MSFAPELPNPETSEQTALACYLSLVVAIGNCMADVCPPAGAMYRDRLLKLPRRLGFDATRHALEQSRTAIETDLLEYSRTARAWIEAGSNHAALLLDHLQATEEKLVSSADLQRAFLDDLAEHIRTSAEVDDEADLRVSFKRYAAGLNAYSRRARAEKLATINDLLRRREEIGAWLAEAAVSTFIDPDTGLLNRIAAERRIETQIAKQKPFCVILVGWREESQMPERTEASSGQIMKELGDRLAATIRPYDVIFRWSQDHLVTIFEAPETDIAMRARQIAGWLADGACAIEINGETSVVKIRTTVSIVESVDEEQVAPLIARVDSLSRTEVAAL